MKSLSFSLQQWDCDIYTILFHAYDFFSPACLGERLHRSDLYEVSRLQLAGEMRDPICEDGDRSARLCVLSVMIVSIRRWRDERLVTPPSTNQPELWSDIGTRGRKEMKCCHYQLVQTCNCSVLQVMIPSRLFRGFYCCAFSPVSVPHVVLKQASFLHHIFKSDF